MSPADTSVAGLILAAGESRRMGFPKALLAFRGETFLDHLISLFAAYCAPVIVVLGAQAERVRAGLRHANRALIVLNEDYQLGQLSSMQRGLRAVPDGPEGVLFTLVDHPAVSPSTLEQLLVPPRPPLRIPRYQGRRGHPIYFSRDLIPEFLALGMSQTARDVIERYLRPNPQSPTPNPNVDLADPGILEDVDDPEAYRRLTSRAAP